MPARAGPPLQPRAKRRPSSIGVSRVPAAVTLFLDFDAVLHGSEVYRVPGYGVVLRGPGTLFEHAPALDAVLAPFPSVRIVLSTSWVPTFGFRHSVRRLPPRLALRVVGSTFHSRYTPEWHLQSRYEQIRSYVQRHRLGARWIALDDDIDGWPEKHYGHVVCPVDITRGLGPSDLELLVDRLSALMLEAKR